MIGPMPKVGDVFDTTKLDGAMLLCIDVHRSEFGVHYHFYVLDGGVGSRFRSWTDSSYDFYAGVGPYGIKGFGMIEAMKTFKFTRVD